ncbi:organoarsenical effux MFS transporter ArsJ [Flocculibacter collagenilyticus]|uniref:organoarsenical effux MFS transporter ArsJ n=1 Tax=Flocculibacter collagenilyticus TaxID=2744479 RepID=UPI0018F42FD5|nr:organoarsenical effux MFS transporter ArsJ [Flocculibacter collagenilyticus]
MQHTSTLTPALKQYLIVTGNYWAFTLTDGALRMLVVLYFHQLGYNPLSIAMLFLFYEFFGVVTNLLGGWLGARIGLNRTMNIGLFLQIIALSMLLVPSEWLLIPWVMAAQALSGIAKDLNKMSAKSAIKHLVPDNGNGTSQHTLYKWVAVLTGSKNALKGVGFFLGGVLLTTLDFTGAIASMAVMLVLVWLFSITNLKQDLGKAKNKPRFNQLFSSSKAINLLSAARLFLFGARDVWFVVALPVYLATALDWEHWTVGSFLALWIIAYGIVQSVAPYITGIKTNSNRTNTTPPDGNSAVFWASILLLTPVAIALGLTFATDSSTTITAGILIIGLGLFGIAFAVNSSLHSYLIVSYARHDGVSLDIGFYYMANAMGRLIGTLLSGWLFQAYGLVTCLWVSALFIAIAGGVSLLLPKNDDARSRAASH